jgi:aminoglycoside phosphotransferase (APT) family kinase protein
MSQLPFQNKVVPKEIDWVKVENYLRSQTFVPEEAPLKVQAFSAGYSNLTYFIQIGDWQAVLRRPPFGPIPPKAHDMKREYDILSNLKTVFPLAPKPYLYCEDPSIMERHFYVMEKKEGVVMDDSFPEEFKNIPNACQQISNAAVSTLVKLHEVDYKQAGLDTIGRPDGYLSRQVHGWIKRYENSKTDEIMGVDALEKWLLNRIPESPSPTIVHNDFKLNNMMFETKNPSKVIGVFDWELSTIGDPLTDVAAMIAYWEQEGDPFTGLTSVTRKGGFASRREILERYAVQSRRDVSQIDYYLTFAFYKIAVILQQLYYRWKIGKAQDDRFEKLGEGIVNLMSLAGCAQRKELL